MGWTPGDRVTTPCIENKHSIVWVDGRMMSPYRHAAAERYGAEAIVGKVVMHMCDNPSCCNPEHLALGTTWDNAQDRTVKGRGYNGHSKRRNEADRWFRDQVMARMREAQSGSQV